MFTSKGLFYKPSCPKKSLISQLKLDFQVFPFVPFRIFQFPLKNSLVDSVDPVFFIFPPGNSLDSADPPRIRCGPRPSSAPSSRAQSRNQRKSRPFCIDPSLPNGLAPILILSTQSDPRPTRPFQGWTENFFWRKSNPGVIHSFYKSSARMTTFAQPVVRLFDQMSLGPDRRVNHLAVFTRGHISRACVWKRCLSSVLTCSVLRPA